MAAGAPGAPTCPRRPEVSIYTVSDRTLLSSSSSSGWQRWGHGPKLSPRQKRHWHLIFGASLNVGRPSPAGGCAGSGEERDHAGFQLGRARGTHSITAWPQPPPRGSALGQGCILPAHLPAQGTRGFSQGKDGQSCAVVAAPVIPGRADVEVTLGKLGRRLGSPRVVVVAPALLPSNSPSASHRSPARSDTRHLRQRRAPALGWPGWTSVAPWKVKKQNKTKK